jgi:hypothetical protein
MLRSSLALLVAVVLVVGSVRCWQQDSTPGKKYALLIGVRKYKREELSDLKYTENDVEKLAKVLEKSGYRRVTVLTQKAGDPDLLPTGENIREHFQAMLKGCKPEDTILLAFSGHGVQFKEEKEHYFCPMDARLGDKKTLVSFSEIYEQLKDCKAATKVLLVDACRNDPEPGGGKFVVGVERLAGHPATARGGVAAFYSCSKGEASYESEPLGHGVFFHFVIQGLEGKAANKKGEVILESLAAYVKEAVNDYVKDRISPKCTQTPHLVSDVRGQPPLVTGVPPRDLTEVVRGFHFEKQEIANDLGVGYAVLLVDLNGDGKKDIVVVDTKRVVWYENPTWKKRIIIEGQTKPDNVCIDAFDIDGDGQIDLALGADWKPFNTKSGGTLQWLKRGKTLDDPWSIHPIAEEPTLHRIRFADVLGEEKPLLLVGPLMGRDSSKEKNWTDGVPLRFLGYRIPKDPVRDRWVPEVLDESLHVMHNFFPIPAAGRKGMDVLTASYEGVNLLTFDSNKWKRTLLGAGNQATPSGSRGASEIKMGQLKGTKFIATIEPWHGHQVVVYTPPADPKETTWQRHVLDEQLKWGHAVWCADLDGDGQDELIIGVRDNLSDKPGEKCGVRIYKATDGTGTKWERFLIDEGGVAVEDLAAADLDGDGRIDIVAVGRASHNARIYWNKPAK